MAQARLTQFARQLRGTSGSHTSNYEVSEQPLGTTHHLRVVCIGAGASGLNLIHTLRRHLTDYELQVYEKNPQVGGTWFENRYPGCKCDIPSHNYQFSWKRNPEWTSFFSPAEEIQAYLCRLCDEEEMYPVIKLEHQVVRACWDEQAGIWNLKVRNLKTDQEFDDHCHFLLDSCGILNNWKWPNIRGLQSFSGELVHSANWPKNFDYTGKTVAVIGNGSSGVQIMPPVQKGAKNVLHFIQEPTWIVPPRVETLAQGRASDMMSQIEMNEREEFTPRQIEKFKSNPDIYLKFIKAIEAEVNGNFPLTATEMVRRYMMAKLGNDSRLCSALIPKFELGCRRLTPAVGYLECLQAENVRVMTDPILEIVPEGIRTSSGEFIQLDAIICATGFNVSFCPRFPIIGRDGNLQDRWTKELPKSYMSCAVPGMPNYFVFLGPNAPIGHGSVFTIAEHIAKYVASIIKKCQKEGIKAISPTQSAVDELAEHTQRFMPRTAWAGSCKSWFKDGEVEGPVTALHPGSRIHFFHMLENFRGEDWEYTYLGGGRNRFRYLGNGFSTKEMDQDDSTSYLDEPDKLC
ncbi:FAD/NAD(P)-binding domain-containing protein [Thozetella sp. PMI_491]|nr:FAD/NAD(P)-binding domain-containing protein [Thozetella sp. PMI_491]